MPAELDQAEQLPAGGGGGVLRPATERELDRDPDKEVYEVRRRDQRGRFLRRRK